jgi:hypothetical protein
MTDDLTTLRDCFDAPDAPPAARAFARAAVLERAAAETNAAVVHLAAAPARTRSRRTGRRVVAVGAAAAVMATAFMVLENVGGTGRNGRPDPIVPGLSVPAANAAEVLERAASASAAKPEFEPPRDDQWIYTAERMTGSDGEPMTQQQWARADGGAHAWIDEAGTLQIQTMERPSDHPARRGILEGYPLVASLPTNAAALRQWAYDRADENWSNGPNSTSEEEIFLFFNHILRGNVARRSQSATRATGCATRSCSTPGPTSTSVSARPSPATRPLTPRRPVTQPARCTKAARSSRSASTSRSSMRQANCPELYAQQPMAHGERLAERVRDLARRP